MDGLRGLSRPALEALAEGLESGRIDLARPSILDLVPAESAARVTLDLRSVLTGGAANAAAVLRALASERTATEAAADNFELVWSGGGGPESRNTAVVVQQLFRQVRNSLVLSSYALQVDRLDLFAALAERMDADPAISARFFVNIERRYGDLRPDGELIREYVDLFRTRIWPGKRLPALYFDPRSLVLGERRACLHAKCLIVDGESALVTSANFTEAAHERNFEAGILIRDAHLARALESQFDRLVAERAVLPLSH